MIFQYPENFKKSKDVMKNIFTEFEMKCVRKNEILLKNIIQTSYDIKLDFAFSRYKSLALCTHSSNSIVSTFGGMVTSLPTKEKNFNLISFMETFNAIECDIINFIKYSKELIYHYNCKISYEKNITKMKLEKNKYLRLLDNISFVSTNLLIVINSFQKNDIFGMEKYRIKICYLRNEIIHIIEHLFENGFLFLSTNKINNFENDIFMDQFLTYDKYQKQNWSLHLLAGLLLIFWNIKSQVSLYAHSFKTLLKFLV